MKLLFCCLSALILGTNAIAQTSPFAENKRFIRGEQNHPNIQSFVIPLNGQKGVALNPLGDNAEKYRDALPWFTRIAREKRKHILTVNGLNSTYGIEFENPIVAFGSEAGGTPLYTNQTYHFGIYGGERLETTDQDQAHHIELLVSIYDRSEFVGSQTKVIPKRSLGFRVPRRGTNEWLLFINSGYQVTAKDDVSGTEFTLKPVEGVSAADTWGVNGLSPYVISVRCPSPNYYIEVNSSGVFRAGEKKWLPMVVSEDGTNPKANTLLVMDFEDPLPWQSICIQQPHFDGKPVPPTYQGKSLEELLQTATRVEKDLGATQQGYLTVDNSPELRRHPILDKLVEDMGRDPLVLANYVLNEIELCDAIGYNENGDVTATSINAGGINRGALATYLEGQGSPIEQCALLLYLLRQAGIPAVYVFPPKDELLMLDARMSRLLRMQLVGLVDDKGKKRIPHLIPVNYPWIAASIEVEGNPRWVHLFPWLKDTEIVEGWDLFELMPEKYASGALWTNAYLEKDKTIVPVGSEGDTVAELFPRFIKNVLQEKQSTISYDDLGNRFRDRKHYYSRWEDFPQPWSVSEKNGKMSLKSSFEDSPGMFNTISIEIFSDRNENTLPDNDEPRLVTGDLRVCELHNRQFFISYKQTSGDNHQMFLTLEPFVSGTLTTGSFDGSDFGKRQEKHIDLGPNDYTIRLNMTHKRQRSLPQSFNVPNYWSSLTGFSSLLEVSEQTTFQKGDLSAVCINVGRVTPRMVDVHVQEFWAQQREGAQMSKDEKLSTAFQGKIAYIMGMAYYEKLMRFQNELEKLLKVNIVSTFAHGFAKLGARRSGDGKLINGGEVDPVSPVVDMSFSHVALAGNSTSRPDHGDAFAYTADHFFPLFAADMSAQEHAVIESYFQQTDAISTVKLLHISKDTFNRIYQITQGDYKQAGEVLMKSRVGNQTPIRRLKDWLGQSIWSSIVNGFTKEWRDYQYVFIPAGPQTGALGTYAGFGAFVMSRRQAAAYITGNFLNGALNGGYGSPVANYSFSPTNFQNISLNIGTNYTPQLSFSAPSLSSPIITPALTSVWEYRSIYDNISSGASIINNYQKNYFDQAKLTLHYNPSGSGSIAQAQINKEIFNRGDAGKTSWWGNMFGTAGQAIADPVNSVTGEFYVDTIDLRLNGPMPLEVRRNYGSQNLADNGFGYGWKMAYFPYLVVTSDSDVIYAAEMDGSVIAYRRKSGSNNEWLPTAADNPHLSNITGDTIGSIGNMFNAQIVKSSQGADTLYTLIGPRGDKRLFKVRSFPVSTLTRERPYLESWQDHAGNKYTFQFGTDPKQVDYGELQRIEASNGNFLGFYYDTYGHITEVYTGDGRRLYYRYDQYGDLIEVTLPDATKISYDYLHAKQAVNGKEQFYSEHLLIRERKPAGRILESDYDDKRRVIVQRATVGPDLKPVQNAAFSYAHTEEADKTITGHTIITDAYGKKTRYDYSKGQITQITDPLNQVIIQEWFDTANTTMGAYPRSIKKRVDKRGLITSFKYDTKGNLIERKVVGDLTGDGTTKTATNTYAYNELNLPTQQVDPIGNRIETFYEDKTYPWLPTRIQQKAKAVLVSQTVNEYSEVSSGKIFAKGLLMQQKVAAGTSDQSISEWTYDARGMRTSMTRFTGTSDPNIVERYYYNLRNELVEVRDAINRKTFFAYDGRGNRVWQERRDEAGVLVSWQYDYYNENGEIEWTDGPRYYPEDYVWRKYDGAGRPSEEIRWRSEAKTDGSGVVAPAGDALYATTFFKHDLFGNLIETRTPMANSIVMTYDAIGQMLTSTAYEGYAPGGNVLAKETLTYEPGGLVASQTNPLGGVTQRTYTTDGKPKHQRNPDGTVMEWRYDLDGRIHREVQPNGNFWETTYDDANRTITRILHDHTNAILAREIRVFDRRGNVIRETDTEGNVFTKTYDGLNRPKAITGPAKTNTTGQQTTTFIYDNSGKVQQVKNGLGEITITTNDALNRPTLVQIKDAGGKVIRQTSYKYAADHNSVTTMQGSENTRIATTTYTDTFNNPVLTVYGNGEKKRNVYDRASNLTANYNELGRPTAWTYNALNYVTSEVIPGGASTQFIRDAAGNLLKRQMPAGLVWQASYDVAGRLLTQETHGGNTVTGRKRYSYFTSGPNVGELQSMIDGRNIVHSYTYDAFGRLHSITSPATGEATGLRRVYSYDKRGLTTRIAETHSGPHAQPATTIDRHYDSYGQLIKEDILIGGAAARHATQHWDAAGRRTSLQINEAPFSSPTYTYTHRSDGLLAGVHVAGKDYTYTYTDAGLLSSRSNSLLTQAITERDPRGRIINQRTMSGSIVPLNEIITWRANSTIASYQASRIQGAIPNERRAYSYNIRGQLVSENYVPAVNQNTVINYQFDNNKPDGLGIRTLAQIPGGYELKVDQIDSVAQVIQESTNTELAEYKGKRRFTVQGEALGAGSISVTADGVPIGPVTYGGYASDGKWSAEAELIGGEHTIKATAHHPSGGFDPSSTSQFTLQALTNASATITSAYNGEGQVLTKTYKDIRTQTHVWDAAGRLVNVQERTINNNGYDWCAVYDGLGRRLRTIYTPVRFGIADTSQQQENDSWYDPQVKYLELGVRISKGSPAKPVETYWQVYGPDLDGIYGSLQGMGGLDAIIRESNGQTKAILRDAFGNCVANVTRTGVINWNATRVGGYGPLPGNTPKILSDAVDLAEATVWRGKRLDPTGDYWLGERYYNYREGRFNSPDPLGHAADMSQYTYANGDPINYVDPDGRFGKGVNDWSNEFNLQTRTWGAAQGVLGSAGAIGSYFAATATAPTVVGGVGFAALGTLSADAAQAGFRTMWTGEHAPTMLNSTARSFGATPTQAAYIELGLNLGVSGGTAFALQAPRMMTAITNSATLARSASIPRNEVQMVIGRLPDTAKYIGENGYHVLNVHPELWHKSLSTNDAWIQAGIDTKSTFKLATEINFKNLTRKVEQLDGTIRHEPTIYLRELKMLRDAGYTRKGNLMIPPEG